MQRSWWKSGLKYYLCVICATFLAVIQRVRASDLSRKVSWKDFYPDAKREDPLDKPEPRGNPVTLTLWTDADHAGCRLTRRSHSGILIFINKALIFWYSKRQTTVETAVYGSEYIAGKIGVDLVDGLIYKLQMFGIPVEGKFNMFIDNESMFKSSTIPASVNKKKHTYVAFHRIREGNKRERTIGRGYYSRGHIICYKNYNNKMASNIVTMDFKVSCTNLQQLTCR